MLNVTDLNAWYGQAQVLRGASLTVEAGEVVTLVGRNGAGKTTLLRCLMGLHPQMSGRIEYDGRDIAALADHRRAGLGLGYVPDDRGIYSSLTVEENLVLPPVRGGAADPWPLDRVYETFPVLRERRSFPGTKLSGGEQQMLSIARVLRMGARMLLCDEPTEGLSPLLVQQIGQILAQVKAQGVTILLIEQNLHFATTLADRHYLIAEGEIVQQLPNSEVLQREHELLDYLGV
jgi:branched-chain amino acid transport system ATP-binding protein